MSFDRKQIQAGLLFLAVAAAAGLCLCPARAAAQADLSLLRQSIIEYNLKSYNQSLLDGYYAGEAGILLIKPEAARSLGLKALINEDYREAQTLDAKADRLFSQAVSALKSQQREAAPGEHAKQAGEWGLASREARAAARKRFDAYRARISIETDERLDKKAASAVLNRLLEESLKQASFNLREALGRFRNRCQDLPDDTPPLTPDNVRFVNFVFSEFQEKASAEDKAHLDLGKQPERPGNPDGPSWKTAAKELGPPFLDLIERCLKNRQGSGYPVDPLLFIALMRRESSFDPRAVSYLGAAGLTQIMPKTGKGLGMEQIFMPDYFEEAMSLFKQERQLRRKAISLISEADPANIVERAGHARKLMQDSLNCSGKRSELFGRYRKELLNDNPDDRLDPCKAIAYGYTYFSDLMMMQKGDMTLALAAYNAGPHRVEQYNGMPPYSETVTFRNTVLKYYREYLDRLNRP